MPTPNSGHANSRRANRPGPLCVVANNKQQQQQQHKSAAARTAVGAARPGQSQACQAAWLLRVAAGLACPRPDSAQPSIQAWQVSAVPRGGGAQTKAHVQQQMLCAPLQSVAAGVCAAATVPAPASLTSNRSSTLEAELKARTATACARRDSSKQHTSTIIIHARCSLSHQRAQVRARRPLLLLTCVSCHCVHSTAALNSSAGGDAPPLGGMQRSSAPARQPAALQRARLIRVSVFAGYSTTYAFSAN